MEQSINKNKKPVKKSKHKRMSNLERFSEQTFLIILTIAITIGFSGIIALYIVLKGPSPTFSNLIVATMWETRRGKAIVQMIFTDEEIEAINARNTVDYNTAAEIAEADTTEFIIPENEKDNIEIIDISGGTYKGKLMIVRDPSRIVLGVNKELPEGEKGYLLENYVDFYDALGGINAGGFVDPGGKGDGSQAYGIVIKDGEIVVGTPDDYCTMIGFNEQRHLIVGDMTGYQALEWGITDAVTFGPVLLHNGHAVSVVGTGGGLNPRTVIGQRADGAVLLLVIDGRQTNSIGATYEDCIKIMLQQNAIVAANLDGGSSSVMIYDHEIINSVVSMNGERTVPTAWIVK